MGRSKQWLARHDDDKDLAVGLSQRAYRTFRHTQKSATARVQADLRFDQGSVADGEANSQGDHTSDKTNSKSDDLRLKLGIGGLGSNRGDGSGEGSDGSSVLRLGLLHLLGELGSGQRLERSALLGDRGERRRGGEEEGEKDGLVGLHCIL